MIPDRTFGQYLVTYWNDGEIRQIIDTFLDAEIVGEDSNFFADEKLHVLANLKGALTWRTLTA